MFIKEVTPEMNELLRRSGDLDYEVARQAQRVIAEWFTKSIHKAQIQRAKALENPLKKGVLKGDNLAGVFETQNFAPGASVEYPLDFLAPGTEKDHVAYTIPNQGRIPERAIEGDYVMVPTFDVANAIDWNLKYARDARWDIAGRGLAVLEAGHVRKDNRDGWTVILAAGSGRNLYVYDDAATGGLFTKRLTALAEVEMRRRAGGNASSVTGGRLTDVFMSPEAHQDVLSWDLTQIPDALRMQIYQNWDNGGVTRIGKVLLHDVDEFGENQEYQTYYTGTLAASMQSGKKEIAVGLDLFNRDSFVRPIREKVRVFEDPTLHRQRRQGYYSWSEGGWSVLDSRRVLILQL